MKQGSIHIAACAALVLLLSVAGRSHAQVAPVRPGDLSPHLDSLFTEGRLDELEVQALRTLLPSQHANENQLVAAHLYLGFVWFLAGREEDAHGAFLDALAERPSLQLDQVYVPPRIYDAFEQARSEFETLRRNAPRKPEPATGLHPRHTFGSMVNLVVPGSGFFATGRPWRGLFWSTVNVAALGGFIYSVHETLGAHDSYVTERNPALIDSRYDAYNTWYKRSWIWGGAFALCYVSSQVDFHVAGMTVRTHPALLDGSRSGAAPGLGLTFEKPVSVRR